MAEDKQHRNDIYGDLTKTAAEAAPLLHAATVVLLRDRGAVEVLMLQKNKNISFGGMWVFPGGRIDDADYPADGELAVAARKAAVRETHEESGLHVSDDAFVWFAHWTPPLSTPKRFATWFFAASAQAEDAVNVDGGEILSHRWINPQEALDRHAAGEIDLAPPTWITLYHLGLYPDSDTILSEFRDNPAKVYETNVVKNQAGERVAMWQGDAGYENSDADSSGERHRLILAQGGFRFENSVEKY
jgi:8-oxo-dGTP pyrophosphatase MutT (NUDIX family)